MKVTLDIPDDLAADLRPFAAQSASIIAAGLREVRTIGSDCFQSAAQFMEKLAELPTPEEILALRPSPELEARISELIEKNRSNELTVEEQMEWQRYEWLEHLVRVAKARAQMKLRVAA